MTITRPVSENLARTAVITSQQNGIKGQTTSTNQNRVSGDSSDNVFHMGTASKGNNSSLQVQKSNVPGKSPPACE